MIRNLVVFCLALLSFLPSLQGSQIASRRCPRLWRVPWRRRHFSFIYGGKSSKEILSGWKRTQTQKMLADDRLEMVTIYTDPATGLEVTWQATEFERMGAVEWIVRLRNTGSADTPMIENLLALDEKIAVPPGTVIFHHVLGSADRPLVPGAAPGMTSDYHRIDQQMEMGTEYHLAHYGMKQGKHVETDLPYFNAQWADGGLVGGIGWRANGRSWPAVRMTGWLSRSARKALTSSFILGKVYVRRAWCCWNGKGRTGCKVRTCGAAC